MLQACEPCRMLLPRHASARDRPCQNWLGTTGCQAVLLRMALIALHQLLLKAYLRVCMTLIFGSSMGRASAGTSATNFQLLLCAGIPWDDRLWDGTWAAVKQVWASKWGERAAGGLRGAGVAQRDLQMAVLVQRVVPARYAFVAHTVHPTAGAGPPLTVFAEIAHNGRHCARKPASAVEHTPKMPLPALCYQQGIFLLAELNSFK